MNIRFLLQHTAALALATGVSTAQAADYEPTIIPAETVAVEEYQPVEIGSGWYIRGDVGYSINDLRGVVLLLLAICAQRVMMDSKARKCLHRAEAKPAQPCSCCIDRSVCRI